MVSATAAVVTFVCTRGGEVVVAMTIKASFTLVNEVDSGMVIVTLNDQTLVTGSSLHVSRKLCSGKSWKRQPSAPTIYSTKKNINVKCKTNSNLCLVVAHFHKRVAVCV